MKTNRYLYYLLLLLIGMCESLQSISQATCSGTALAPVFKQTFGTSASSTTKTTVPSGFITTYAFNGSSSLADGQYMVTPLVQNAQKSDWAVGGDHTGDTHGNMFLVNAGTGASLFFKQQVDNLCPGSTYSFSAWIVNVNTTTLTLPICGASIVYPNVTFNIKNTSGTVLASFNTGNIPLTASTAVAPNWQQYGFQFSLPAGTTSLVLEMVDYYGGLPQCGNDLAIDDIMFSACTPQATIALNTSSSICEGTSTTMSSSLLNSPFVTPAYQWQKSTDGGTTWNNIGTPGTSATSFPLTNVTASDGGKYRVIVGPDVSSLSSNSCVTASNTITLTVNTAPSVSITSNSPVCIGTNTNLSANVSGGLAPYTYSWSGPSSFVSSIASPVITGTTSGNAGSYALTVTDANSCAASLSTSVTVPPTAPPADAGPDQGICIGNTVTLGANTPSSGFGSWSQVSGPGIALINTPFQSNPTVSGLVAGVYKFRWTIIVSPACPSATDDVDITVVPATVAGSLSGAATVCSGSNSGNILLSGYTGSIVQWESSTDGGTTWLVIANTTNSLSYNNLSATTIYRALVQNGSCNALYSNNITINVAAVTNAGSLAGAATVCSGLNAGTLTLSGYTGAILQWEYSTNAGTSWTAIGNTTNTHSYNNLTATTLFRVLVQSSPCTSQYSNTVQLTVNQPTVAGTISGNATVCAASNSGSITLAGNTGSVVQWESSVNSGASWTVIANTSSSLLYSNLSATTVYRVLVQNGACATQYSNQVTITVNQATVGGTLSGAITVCASSNSGNISLAGNLGNVVQWESSIDGGATWIAIANTTNNLSYNNLIATTAYRVLIENGVCAAAYSNTITITVNQPTVAGTLGGSATVCASSNNGTITLAGNTGGVVHWESSSDGGATWVVIANTTGSLSYTNLAATTIYRVLIQNGVCAVQYSNLVSITVNQATVGGTLSGAATVCASSNSGNISLAGNLGNVVQWESSTDGGVTWTVVANTTNSLSYNNLIATTAYRVLIQNGVCAAAYSNTITITVNQPTVAGTLGGSATVCASSNNGTITLAGNTGNIIHWESSTDGGTTWAVITNTTNSLSYNNLSATTIYRVLLQNGVCAVQYSNLVTITVNQATVGGTLSGAATVCASSNSGNISLAGNLGNVVQWESSVDGGVTWVVIVNTTNSLSYNNLAATTLYRVLIQNGVCAASYSNMVMITVNQSTVAGTLSGNATVCASANNGNIVLSGNNGNIVQWESSVDGGTTWAVITTTTNSLSYNHLTQTTAYRVLVQNGVCAAQYSNIVTIAVDQPTVTGILSSDAVVCITSNNGTISLAGYSGSITQWETSVNGGGTWSIVNNTQDHLDYQNITTTTLYRAAIKNGVCASAYSNNITVQVTPATVAGVLGQDAIVCATSNNGVLGLSGYTGTIKQWEYSNDNGATWSVINSTTNTTIYTNLSATTAYRVLVKNGVCGPQYSNNATITVNAATVAGTASGNATVCASSNNGSIQLTGNTGNILRWESSVDGGNSWLPISGNSNTIAYQNLTISTAYRAFVQNGVCAPAYSNIVTVQVDQPTVAGLVSADAIVCVTANSGSLLLKNYTGNIQKWQSSTDNGNNWIDINNTTDHQSYQNIATTTLYRALVQNGVCSSSNAAQATISVIPAVTRSNAGADIAICNASNVSLSANMASSGNGSWRMISGPSAVTFTNAGSAGTIANGMVAGTYRFEWTISNNVCADSRDTVDVMIHPALTNLTDTVTKTVCRNQPITINGSGATGGSNSYQYQWEESADGTRWTAIAGATSATYTFNATATIYLRRNVQSLPCQSESGITLVKVQESVTNNRISGDQAICMNTLAKQIDGSMPTGGDGNYSFRWQQSVDTGNTWIDLNAVTGTQHFSAVSGFTKSTWFRRIVSTNVCTGPLSNTSNTVAIIVNPVPTASLQYKGGIYCQLNTAVDFVAVASNTDSIRWNFGDGTIVTGSGQKTNHNYTSRGTFIPSVRLISSKGCTTDLTAADTIRVDELRAGFTITAAFDCGRSTYRFTDTTQSFFPINKREWTINQLAVNGGKELKQEYTNAGRYEAGLRLQNIYGCNDALKANYNVGIYTYPKADINAIGQACLNDPLQFQSIINSPDSVKARIWNLGNGSSATDSVVKVSYYTAGEYVVKLMVGTVNNCYDSALKQLSIHPLPKVNVQSDNIVCKGDSLTLKADGASTYIWKENDQVVCTNCNTLKISPQRNTQYKVVGYSEFGCSQVAATNVRVIQPFRIDLAPADTICAGQSRRLVATGASNYTWRNDAGLSTYNTGITYASPAVTTTYHVIGRDNYNCFADTAEIRIVVGKPTGISIGRDTSILSGEPIRLHAVSTLPDIRKWQWKGNATFSCINCTEPTAKVIQDECLSCTATNIYGCASTDTVCITTFCPGSEVFIPNAFSPDGDGVNDILFVQGRGIKLIKSFRVFSRWGELVFEKLNFSPGDRSAGWDGRIRGKLASPDVYVYVCEAICEKGTPAIFKGNTAILK